MSILDAFSLKGKVALVAGGGGNYGRGVVRSLAEAGAITYIGDLPVQMESVVTYAETLRAEGFEVHPIVLDQTDEASVHAAVQHMREKSGKIDILVNNAVARPMKKGYSDDASTFETSMKINATGLFIVTRAVGDAMTEGGSIINIGSIQGMVGPDPTIYEGTEMNGWYPDYFFHKGGMVNLTRFMASYYGKSGVRCNCILPGGLLTENLPERFVRQYSEKTCLGMMANTKDLMGIIVFLASDASAYITGTNIPVDGGYTAK
ncbi:MAG: SDR family NAD(P)-dependent oxidoreductase [Armatimonadota bacterium]